MSIAFVYETTNLINSKTYTGSTGNDLLNGSTYKGSGKALLKAVAKYGRENFSVKILAICPDRQFAYVIEEEIVGDGWTASTNYNLERPKRCRRQPHDQSGANNPMYGKTHSEDARRKISEASRSYKRKPVSAETRKLISEIRKGKPRSEATRRKISRANVGNAKACKKCVIDGIHFNSQTEAAEYFDTYPAKIRRWINNGGNSVDS